MKLPQVPEVRMLDLVKGKLSRNPSVVKKIYSTMENYEAKSAVIDRLKENLSGWNESTNRQSPIKSPLKKK